MALRRPSVGAWPAGSSAARSCTRAAATCSAARRERWCLRACQSRSPMLSWRCRRSASGRASAGHDRFVGTDGEGVAAGTLVASTGRSDRDGPILSFQATPCRSRPHEPTPAPPSPTVTQTAAPTRSGAEPGRPPGGRRPHWRQPAAAAATVGAGPEAAGSPPRGPAAEPAARHSLLVGPALGGIGVAAGLAAAALIQAIGSLPNSWGWGLCSSSSSSWRFRAIQSSSSSWLKTPPARR